MRPIVHLEDAADDRRVAAEAALPVLVAQHQDGRCARLLVRVLERTPERRPHAEHVEEVRGDDARGDALGLRAAEQDEPHVVEFHESLEALRARAVVENLLIREAGVLDVGQRPLLPQHDEAVAVLIRQRAEQDAVDDAEDRRVGADPERHRQHDHDREARVAAEIAQPVAQVLGERLEQPRQPGVAHVVLDAIEGAERAHRRPPGVAGRHAGLDVLLGEHVDVESELLVEIVLEAVPGGTATRGAW